MGDKVGNEWKVFAFLGGLGEVGHGHAGSFAHGYHYPSDKTSIPLISVLTLLQVHPVNIYTMKWPS